MEIRYFFVTDNIRRNKLSVIYCPTADMLGDYFTKPQQGSRMRQSRIRILNLKNDPSLISQECVEASTPKLDAVKCEHNLIINDTCKSTNTKTDTCQSCVPRNKNSDVMRYKAGSYLMAARGLLKRVSKIDSSLLLTNLK